MRHRLADAKTALEFARPLLFGAAVTLDPVDVAAAKTSACEAAYTTARTALQLHGAIGYSAEYDLSLWLTKARALRGAWGSPGECRAAVLDADSTPHRWPAHHPAPVTGCRCRTYREPGRRFPPPAEAGWSPHGPNVSLWYRFELAVRTV